MEHFAERAGVFVSDRPSDLLDRLFGEFEHLSCLADAQALAILGRLETRRLVKTSQEGALFEAARSQYKLPGGKTASGAVNATNRHAISK
jgi:hypothetical protein